MYCPYCGAWNPEESKYCAKCGQRLQSPAQESSGIGTGLIVVIAAVTAGALIAIAAFLARDRLTRAWQGFFARPTEVAAIATSTASPVPVRPTATLPPTVLPSPTSTAVPTATPSLTRAPETTPTPKQRTFKLVYRDCVPHGFSLGSVKGQVFDKAGRVIPGARIRITINGYEWKSDANPATTNSEGWYEWVLEPGQKVQFVELIVDGRSVPFLPSGFEVKASGGCFQRVDFVEQ